ncbi:GNAT family N-acetyltransferase [Actinomadura sp. HBU206391]|uniref:GNAT family N-acetyltransferase n=1 Tax=Actinomadura sp. HBU206391 TaxID=2731692 RepID=UPI00165069C4|nr:GNAT family N-acetyltransferase [Actinomadura sp. HBU206391]MBC6459649.1 GNAT family N-acetyltransferase [Actinomadura sp. HBU206391]
MKILTTQRLTLAPWQPSHLDELRRMAGDERVVRFVGDRRPWSAALSEARHEAALDHWARHGYGWRAALDHRTGEFTGLAALTHREPGEFGTGVAAIELGWWVEPHAWGRGLATEIACAVRDEAFLDHHAELVLTRHQEGNAATARIIAKLGLVHHHSAEDVTQDHRLIHVHVLDRTSFLAARPTCAYRTA